MNYAVRYYSKSGNTKAVAEEFFYVRNKPNDAQLKEAAGFAQKYL